MTLEQIEQERKRFEASEVAQDLDLTKQVDGDGYLYYPSSVCWFAWLARAQEADKPPMTWREQEYDPEADR